MTLTDRDCRVLDAVKTLHANGVPVTAHRIAKAVGAGHHRPIYKQLNRLRGAGLIEPDGYQFGGLRRYGGTGMALTFKPVRRPAKPPTPCATVDEFLAINGVTRCPSARALGALSWPAFADCHRARNARSAPG